jgi:hypothetical protein
MWKKKSFGHYQPEFGFKLVVCITQRSNLVTAAIHTISRYIFATKSPSREGERSKVKTDDYPLLNFCVLVSSPIDLWSGQQYSTATVAMRVHNHLDSACHRYWFERSGAGCVAPRALLGESLREYQYCSRVYSRCTPPGWLSL